MNKRFHVTTSQVLDDRPARRRARLCLIALATLFMIFGCARNPATVGPVGGKKVSGGEAVVQTARTGLGAKYKLGGMSPQTGFDCSGFVLWSYKQHGLNLPRNTLEQMKAGVEVKRSNLKPGDLVIFRLPSSPNGYHTGIYCGNGYFIHSPSAGKHVREDELSNVYWTKRFHTARRIF